MSLLTDLVEELRCDLGVHSAEDTAAFRLILAAPPGFSTEVTIAPESVLEWYVKVFDTAGDEVWSDWHDYLGYAKNEDRDELTAVMVRDIRDFMRTMAEVEDFRVSTWPIFRVFGFTFGRMKVAEWLRGGEWHSVGPFAPPNEPPPASAQD